MELKWTNKALSDLARLYEFLAPVNRDAAARTVQSLTAAPASLLENPRIGEKLEEFAPREVRAFLLGITRCATRFRHPRSTCCGYGIRERIASACRIRSHEQFKEFKGARFDFFCRGYLMPGGTRILKITPNQRPALPTLGVGVTLDSGGF